MIIICSNRTPTEAGTLVVNLRTHHTGGAATVIFAGKPKNSVITSFAPFVERKFEGKAFLGNLGFGIQQSVQSFRDID